MVSAAELTLANSRDEREALARSHPMSKQASLEDLSKTGRRIVVDNSIWSEPKREGRRQSLAEHQTAAARHLANTLLLDTANTWTGPDTKLSNKEKHCLAQLSSVPCDGSCCNMDENEHGSSLYPELCPICNQLKRVPEITRINSKGMTTCVTCDKGLEHGHDGRVCRACQIFWLVRNNAMSKRLAPYLVNNDQVSSEVVSGTTATRQPRQETATDATMNLDGTQPKRKLQLHPSISYSRAVRLRKEGPTVDFIHSGSRPLRWRHRMWTWMSRSNKIRQTNKQKL